MEESYLHNTAPRNLYLALFPWCNTGQSGQKCSFSLSPWEVNSSSWVCFPLPAQGAGCKLNTYFSGMTIYHGVCGTSMSSKLCFLQALASALCWYLNVVYQLPKLGLSCACQGRRGVCSVLFLVSVLREAEGKKCVSPWVEDDRIWEGSWCRSSHRL